MGQEETVVRRSLSFTPHTKYYIEQLKRLGCIFDTVTMKHELWPTNDHFDCGKMAEYHL